jgi:hypothetical protein
MLSSELLESVVTLVSEVRFVVMITQSFFTAPDIQHVGKLSMRHLELLQSRPCFQ